jgi:hypothetical protein
MESKFPQRVALERMSLDAVNGSGLFSSDLVGLSMACINVWLEHVMGVTQSESRDALFAALVDISHACHAEADISDEIFHDIDPSVALSALDRLKSTLARMGSS